MVDKETRTSVKSYKQSIEEEKQNMAAYANKFGRTVKSLQHEFKHHSKDLKEAALKMREDGNKKMASKVRGYREEVKNQIKENKEAVMKMADGVKHLIGETNKKKRDFKAYIKGPFQAYINAFWG